MDKEKKTLKIPGVIMVTLSSIGIVLWLGLTLFSLLFGGSPGPGYERTVPIMAVFFMALGAVGSIIGVNAGVKALRGFRKAAFNRVGISVAFCMSASLPLFMLDLLQMGVVCILVGLIPSLLFVFAARTRSGKNIEQ